MSALAVVSGLSLGLGLSFAAWQARLAFLAWLAFQRKDDKPAPPPAADLALMERLSAVEGELARIKVERLTGRR